MSESRTLSREREKRSEWEHGEERVDSTVKEGKFLGGEGGHAKTASLGEVGKRISKLLTHFNKDSQDETR